MAEDETIEFTPGDVIAAGKYRITRLLGQGGMGRVYGACCNDDTEVAIKVLHPSMLAEKDALPRFRAEMAILRKLDHHHIAKIIDSGDTGTHPTHPDVPFFAMEKLSGKSLKDIVNRYRKLRRHIEPILIYSLAHDLFKGLAYIHANDIVHRDIKPENLFVRTIGSICFWKIGDFGVSKLLSGSTLSTGLGGYVGTPRYSAKEQFLGLPPTGKADMYSAGVVLFRAATLLTPFYTVPDVNELVRLICLSDPPPIAPSIEEFRDDISSRAVRFIKDCLSHDSAQRPDAAMGVSLFGELVRLTEKELGIAVNTTYTAINTTIESVEEGVPIPEREQEAEDAEFLRQLEMEGTTAKAGPKDTFTMGALFGPAGTLRMYLAKLFGLAESDTPTEGPPRRRVNEDEPTRGPRPRTQERGGTLRIPTAIPGSIAANHQNLRSLSITPSIFTRAKDTAEALHQPIGPGEHVGGRTLILLGRSSLVGLALLSVIGAGFLVKKNADGASRSPSTVAASMPPSDVPPSNPQVTPPPNSASAAVVRETAPPPRIEPLPTSSMGESKALISAIPARGPKPTPSQKAKDPTLLLNANELELIDDSPRAERPPPLPPAPPPGAGVADYARATMLRAPEVAKRALQARFRSGKATREELLLLKTICREQHDSTCLAQCDEALAQY